MVRSVMFNVDKPSHNILTPITPGFSAKASQLYPYDPAKAAGLLDQAGWTMGPGGIRSKNGKQLSLDVLIFSGAGFELPTQFVVSELAKVGFTARTTVQPFTAAMASFNQGVQNLGSFGYYGMDPYLLNIWVNSNAIKSGFNTSHYSNPKVDAMIAKANSTVKDAARNALYQTICDTIMADAPYLPLWDVNGAYTTRNVQNLKTTLNGHLLFHSARVS
jgi:peptide/nickel transport system substrate-binding protein